MLCIHCGATLRHTARVCIHCGTAVPSPDEAATASPVVAPAPTAAAPQPREPAPIEPMATNTPAAPVYGAAPAADTAPAPEAAPSAALHTLTLLNSPALSNPMVERFAKFWAKGTSGSFECWRYSNQSQEEAQRLADQRAIEIAARFRQLGEPPKKYIYSDQKLREPVIEEVHQSVISRNAYGALILNTSQAMFVDIDLPAQNSGGFLKRLFGGSSSDPRQDILKRVQDWTLRNPGWGWRVYDTAAGMRLLATHQVFEPNSAVVQTVFEELGADPLYRVLCRVQKCFRARLTPKPWRCEVAAPKVRWPWANPQEEVEFAQWLRHYEKQSALCATTRLVTTLGLAQVHPAVAPIIALHDERTHALSAHLPLA